MELARALATGPLAAWAGRLLLLGAVLFWWGGVLVPNLVSLAFPGWLAPEAIPRDLNPEIDGEGRLANRVSAGALLVLGLLASASAAVSRQRAAGWIVVGGWTALAATAMFLAWEEIVDFHATFLPGVAEQLFASDFVSLAGTYVWVLLASPLIVGFVLAMGVFYVRGLRRSAARGPFLVGLGAWLLVLACEGLAPFLIQGRAHGLLVLLEETLEFGGALMLGLGAASVWSPGAAQNGARWRGRFHVPAIGSAIAVVLLGGLYVGLVYRVPLVDARAAGGQNAYWLSLEDRQSAAQEFPMPDTALSRFRLKLAYRGPDGRSGVAIWRVIEARDGAPGLVVREGQVDVPAAEYPVWVNVDVPLLSAPEGSRLLLQVVAETKAPTSLRVGMVQGDRWADGRLWVNGALTWPDQDLEFVAHGAPELTRSKLASLWQLVSADWRWAGVSAKALLALWTVTLIPVLLAGSKWRGRKAVGIPSALR